MSAAVRVALYARVSTDRQAQAGTIESQIALLEQRIQADGVPADALVRYVDDGYSGSLIHRPALDRLRDASAAGLLDRLYLLEPDRLARTFVYQWLLSEEFQAAGVELIWVQHAPAATAEEQLLVQIQGSVAEYERAKILERCRRGRRYAAQQGQVQALSFAPYGYRYVTKADGGGAARYEVDLAEAGVVRQIFRWVTAERCSTVEVVRRLAGAGIPTRTGKATWQRPAIHDLLTNPAYRGEAAFGRTRIVREGGQLHGTRGVRRVPAPPAAWIMIPVPPIVSPALFAAAAEQLASEQRRVQPATEGYLLTGLVRCGSCGSACVGRRTWKDRPSGRQAYHYYRCQGTDRRRTGGVRLCHRRGLPMDLVDAAVWHEVRQLLADPGRVLTEYQRRLDGTQTGEQQERAGIERQLHQAQRARDRLIESYTEGVIDKQDFVTRIGRFDARLARLQEQRDEARQVAEQETELRLVIGRLDDFATTVQHGLDHASLEVQHHLITTLVKRIDLETDALRLVFRIDPGPAPPVHSLHFCTDRPTTSLFPKTTVSNGLERHEPGSSRPFN
jgi:site-specific DNA recombinase